jgi:hypothetical protein
VGGFGEVIRLNSAVRASGRGMCVCVYVCVYCLKSAVARVCHNSGLTAPLTE